MARLSTDKQLEFIKLIETPATWSEAFLSNPRDPQESLILKSYQREVLDASLDNKYIVLRFGRRCIPYYSPILLTGGEEITAGRIIKGDTVLSYNNITGYVEDEVTEVYDNGIQDIYDITLDSGDSIQCSSNHPLLTTSINNSNVYYNNWQSLDDGLRVGRLVGHKSGDSRKNSPIKSIEFIGQDHTFDITVKDNHNFISNNIISHNSGKSVIICVDSLWWTLAQPLHTMYSENGS